MELTVNLGRRSYKLVVDHNCASELPSRLKMDFPSSRFALVTNSTIAKLYSGLIEAWKQALDPVIHIMPDGEQYKTLSTWSAILDTLLNGRLERSSVLIALGGGVVGDVAGFAAACFLRGIDCVQVPTTLLSMVDSSVGGKTAVDHPYGKNLIGAFHQPRLVFIDTAFLDTLPQREFISGYAEMFKNAFIGGPDMFEFINDKHESILQKESTSLLEGIKRSISIKADVVAKDEVETKGMRELLNLGHTFAHALEKNFNYVNILHGEAVFWGIKCAYETGKLAGTISPESIYQYEQIIGKMPLPALPGMPDPEIIYNAMFSDKKVLSGKLRLVLPAQPGFSVIRNDISRNNIFEAMKAVFQIGIPVL